MSIEWFSPFILNILCIPVRRCLVGFVSHGTRGTTAHDSARTGDCREKNGHHMDATRLGGQAAGP